MIDLLSITWTVEPDIISSPLTIRWYGLLFATAFMVGYQILKRIFEKEGINEEWLDKALMYTMIGTIVGARLGHVLFYDLQDYLADPIEILMIWHGGLASHGAAIGVLIALWLFSKRVSKKPMLWILDRVVLTVAIGAMFVRLGNLMNHEIIGTPTDLPWGFIFTKAYPPDLSLVPRHPAQVYEAICYLVLFLGMAFLYHKKDWGKRQGGLFGVFLIGLFTARFFVEFVKNSQGGFESGLGNILSTGQWLSIPFIAVGVYFLMKSKKKELV